MSITQTYYLAHKARAKLSHEAARSDHDLRLLVGHANLLDSLMVELADAEREQESWFNQSVRSASHKKEDKHIQWADTVVEEPEEDWDAEDADSDSSSDSDSDFDDDEDIEMADAVSLRRVPSNNVTSHTVEVTEEEVEEDEEEDYAHLSLTRSPSHSASPPELDHDSDSSDDESMPPSPPTAVLPTFSEKQRESIVSEDYEDKDQEAFYDQGFYLPPRNPARIVSAISVY
ncbi:hypothetical protein NKR23_g2186 [Pleurostoma richardsiae]|uniref:Uncharacterized protein n=1 Tax=Pleurostoma richardsiae TaxID=41990 RepID=A0AA38S1T6_9PEZI|nr:hypothetical protein NKR23_g2186 [Pleurostoma richardsiae]